jgi:hypothetical protein
MHAPSPLLSLVAMIHAMRSATILLALVLSGCHQQYIPNTDVEDNSDNRRVIEFCEEYRKALERKDIPTLLSMASERYYEDGGNADASDDIDYAGLKDYLSSKFEEATGIRYEIRYRRITAEDEHIFIDYTYSGSYRIDTKEGEKWKSAVEENRLELVPEGERFKIVAGM